MSYQELAGRTAVVTGAAGGMGREIARQLAHVGATVAMVDRDDTALVKTAVTFDVLGLKVVPFSADVSSSSEVDATVEAIERSIGPIDYLVNAAGVLRLGRAEDLSDDDWAAMFGVNTHGVFHVSRAVVRRMAPRGRGALVTVTSNAATTARAEMSAYAASKAAATAFTKCLGLEVAGSGIRCNVVAPGSTDTPMLNGMRTHGAVEASIEGTPEAYRVGIPLRKVALPADIANAVVFLLSDRASHITMQHLTIDGGATLGA